MIEKCHTTNDLLSNLLDKMTNMLPFIYEAKHLAKLSLTRSILFEMVKSIDGCCKFVMKYISANFFSECLVRYSP